MSRSPALRTEEVELIERRVRGRPIGECHRARRTSRRARRSTRLGERCMWLRATRWPEKTGRTSASGRSATSLTSFARAKRSTSRIMGGSVLRGARSSEEGRAAAPNLPLVDASRDLHDFSAARPGERLVTDVAEFRLPDDPRRVYLSPCVASRSSSSAAATGAAGRRRRSSRSSPGTSAGTGRAGSRRSTGAAGPCTIQSRGAGRAPGRPPRPVQEIVRTP